MSDIELHERYPLSRHEDITDAYMRGVEFGRKMGRGTCRDDNVGGDFVCSECQALVQLHSIGRSYVDKFGKRWYATSNEHGLNFCPNCGRRIVEVDG